MTVCAQALHRSQLNLANYGVIYFDTEMKFDAARLAEILFGAESFSLSQALTNDVRYSQLKLQVYCLLKIFSLHNIFIKFDQIKRPSTCKELLENIEGIQAEVMADGVVLVSSYRLSYSPFHYNSDI